MHSHRLKTKKKGAILSLILMAALLLSMGSLALIALGTQARMRSVKNVLQVSARFAADAGIERTLYLMNQDLAVGIWVLDDVPTYTSEPLTASNSAYTVSYTGNITDGYVVTSVGQAGGQTKTVRVTIALTSPIADDFAVYSKESISMKNKSKISGFNSSDPLDKDFDVKIGTESTKNGAIDLKNGSTVDGDIVIGAGGDPDTVIAAKKFVTINGEVLFLPPTYSLETLTPPDYTASQGSISGSNITLTSSDSGKYNSITINNNGTLLIDEDVTLYVTGDITLKNSAAIEVDNDATLTLYFDGDIDAKNSSGINTTSQIPGDVRLYGTGTDQKIDIKNGSDLYAVIYAPSADMVVHNQVDIFGSFMVNNFELKSGGEVYYDEALKEIDINDELVRFSIVRWEEL